MAPLYACLLVGSFSVPFLYTVLKQDFIKNWKEFIVSTTVVALFFLGWDYIFTERGVWGFNLDYCLGIEFSGMPLEEWLFFFIIPFCSLFAHFALFSFLPSLSLSKGVTMVLSLVVISVSLILALVYIQRDYTFINFLVLAVVMFAGLVFQIETLQRFFISFLLILIPFFIVNGTLTGMFTGEPVVWYNDKENLGLRIVSIPVEDIGYAFSMLFSNLFIYKIICRLSVNK